MAKTITNPEVVTISGWPAGVNNVRDLRDLQRGEAPALRAAVNVDISESGRPSRRKGYSLIQAGLAHSLFAPNDWPFGLLVIDGALTSLRNDDGAETLTTLGAIDKVQPVAYCEQNDWIYGTNGLIAFRVSRDGDIAAWGVPMPAGMPLAAPTANGTIPAGRYQLTLTYIDAHGEESGARAPMLVETTAAGGISLTDIPQPVGGVDSIRVYVSPQNGEELYHAVTLPVGTTSYTLYSVSDLGKGLETLHCDRIPPARKLCAHRGRIYFAIGDTVYYTLPLRYGLFKCHQTYFRFPGRVTAIGAIDDALIVGTADRAYRLSGNDPADMTMLPIDDHGIVDGAMIRVSGGALSGDGGNAANLVWWSTKGVLMRAMPGGLVVPVTQGRLSVPRFAAGSFLYREQDELAQLVSVLRAPQAPSAFAARDRADAEIVRNGITL